MANKKWAKIFIYVMGILILVLSHRLDLIYGIIDKAYFSIVLVYMFFIAFIFVFFKSYKVKDDNNFATNNKLLLMFAMMSEFAIVLALSMECKYGGVPIIALYSIIQGVVGDYAIDLLIFFKKEDARWFRYLLLGEFALGYLSTSPIASNWVFLLTIPMFTVCTLYHDEKFLKIAGITFSVTTLAAIVRQLYYVKDKERMIYHIFIYIVVWFIYVIYAVGLNMTSRTISKVNDEKYNEIIKKQEAVKSITREMIEISKRIKEDAYNTNNYIEELEVETNDSLVILEDIEQGNSVNAESTRVQTDLTFNINEMINSVKNEVSIVIDKTRSSFESIRNSIESINVLKDKSKIIEKSNEEVISSIKKFIDNITKVKSIIAGIVEISEQTELLALNAAIESSRVGEEGKGFVVVSNEVRSLSDETSKLIENISKVIDRLERNAYKARKLIYDVVESVNNENTAIDETVIDFNDMDVNISKLDVNIKNILDKFEGIAIHSKRIEEKSSLLALASKIANEKTLEAVKFNKNNKEKAIKTKEVMKVLVNNVKELDEFIADNLQE